MSLSQTIQISRNKHENIKEYVERLRETIEVLSDKETVKKLQRAVARMKAGKFLTKKDIQF